MARLRGDVIDQTIEKIAAMSTEDRMRFDERLKGFMRAKQPAQAEKMTRVRKTKAPAEVSGV